MSLSMSRAEREAFLADVHVGVLTVAAGEGSGPLATPVWYSYHPGGSVVVTTGGNSLKARAIAAAGRISLCAQDEAPPYEYVTVEGRQSSSRPILPSGSRSLAAIWELKAAMPS